MSERVRKPATIGNIANVESADDLTEMVNDWLNDEDLPLRSWDEIEPGNAYQAEILRVAIAKWEELSESDYDAA